MEVSIQVSQASTKPLKDFAAVDKPAGSALPPPPSGTFSDREAGSPVVSRVSLWHEGKGGRAPGKPFLLVTSGVDVASW